MDSATEVISPNSYRNGAYARNDVMLEIKSQELKSDSEQLNEYTLYTFLGTIIPYRTERVHFLGACELSNPKP